MVDQVESRRDPAPGPAPTRRRTRPRPGDVPPGTVVDHVLIRPPRSRYVLLGLVPFVITGGARGHPGLATLILRHGETSAPALGLYAFWALAWTWVVLSLIRARTDLRARPGRGPTLTTTGALRRRLLDLDGAHEVVLVTIGTATPTTHALLLDATGAVLRRLPGNAGLWRRQDVGLLLADAGITVRYDHTQRSGRTVEATYPGATTWAVRHPVWFALMIVLPVTYLLGGLLDALSSG